jgi:ABC-2 type transport system ATP-binding protein
MNEEALINVEHLSRYYGELCAVDDVSFAVARGEVLGFLGPNGAGKTSTMQVISGNLAPSAGRVRINGFDILDEPRGAKASLGYLPEIPPLYRELTVDEYLRYCARLNRIARAHITGAVNRARERCGLTDVGRRLIGNLSKGYQQRVGIAQAIIHSPAVVILDEPTVGLDPIQIREIRTLIRELGRDHGVILSTHILPEVQATCDRVLIINRGKVALTDTLEGLNRRMRATSLRLGLRRPPDIAQLQTIDDVASVEPLDAHVFRVHFSAGASPAARIAELAVANNWGLEELAPERHTLEQIFIDITCKESTVEDSGEQAA